MIAGFQMMTKEKLEHIRSSLSMCLDHYYVNDYGAYHECCDGKVEDTNGEINTRGHLPDCHLMSSVKIVEKAIKDLELEHKNNLEFIERIWKSV
jgi:hypothetical protein